MYERGVGWVTAAPGLVTAVRSAKQFLTYVASGPFQYAVAEALSLPGSYLAGFRADMQAKRDLLASGLKDAGFDVFTSAGTYFITTGIRPLGESDGFAFRRALPERAGVVAIPNAVFYDHRDAGAPFVRFAFCKRTEVLGEAVQRLKPWRADPAAGAYGKSPPRARDRGGRCPGRALVGLRPDYDLTTPRRPRASRLR